MTLWLDAQLSPTLAHWITESLGIPAVSVRDLGLRDAIDRDIFAAARDATATVLTKDSDFVYLLERLGPPPQVIWLTCGNTSNAHLRTILATALSRALGQIGSGEPLVEISDRW